MQLIVEKEEEEESVEEDEEPFENSGQALEADIDEIFGGSE